MSVGELLEWMGTHYQSEAIVRYETQGLVTRPYVTVKKWVGANKTEFKLYGGKTASYRGSGQPVPISKSDASAVPCQVFEDSVGDYVDKTEAMSHNSDEKMPMVEVATNALGRAADQAVYNAMFKNTGVVKQGGANGTALTYDACRKFIKEFKKNKVRGEIVCIVGPSAFDQLLGIEQFTKSNFVGAENLPIPTLQAKRWLGVLWVEDTELAIDGSVEHSYMFEKSAVGYGYTQDIETEWSWENPRKSYFLRADIVHGAAVIQPKGAMVINVPA